MKIYKLPHTYIFIYNYSAPIAYYRAYRYHVMHLGRKRKSELNTFSILWCMKITKLLIVDGRYCFAVIHSSNYSSIQPSTPKLYQKGKRKHKRFTVHSILSLSPCYIRSKPKQLRQLESNEAQPKWFPSNEISPEFHYKSTNRSSVSEKSELFCACGYPSVNNVNVKQLSILI